MKKIVFVSPFHQNEEHSVFEASIIKLYYLKYPDCNFLYLGQSVHFSSIKQLLPKWVFIRPETSDTKNRIALFFLCLFRSYFCSQSTIIYLSLDLHYLYFFSVFWPKISTIFMHRYPRDWKNFFVIMINLFLLKFFLFFQRSAQVFLLWEWIYSNIINDKSLLEKEKEKFHWINHPFLVELKKFSPTLLHPKICFWFIGRQQVSYKKIATSDLFDIQSFILKSGGNLILTGENFITQDKYFQTINDVDYMVFIFDPMSYMYRCSGIFIEAIMFEKPIICLSNWISDYFFQKLGNIGYKCPNIQELKKIVFRINTMWKNTNEYNEQKENIRLSKYLFSDPDLFLSRLFSTQDH